MIEVNVAMRRLAMTMFKKILKRKKTNDWYSPQVDDMWKKIDSGIEVRVKNFLSKGYT